jgi:hypothetical protein
MNNAGSMPVVNRNLVLIRLQLVRDLGEEIAMLIKTDSVRFQMLVNEEPLTK